MSLYSETIRRYALDDRYAGTLESADGIGEVGLGREQAGRQIAARFALRVGQGRVTELRFQVFGCGFSMAACAAAAELAVGRPLAQAATITPELVDRQLQGLPAERRYCAELAANALQSAVTSALTRQGPVGAALQASPAHGPRVSADNPLLRKLLAAVPPAVEPQDRRLFAGLVAVSLQESAGLAGLGLKQTDLARMLRRFFPGMELPMPAQVSPTDPALRSLLLTHVPAGAALPVPRWLALILAARSAQPGHLWVAMGLPDRPALTAAIERHLPTLAAANNGRMRWKRFFAKQLCEQSGGSLCRAPNCGLCPEYADCFPADAEDV